jgi:hypothetical protein
LWAATNFLNGQEDEKEEKEKEMKKEKKICSS